LKNVVDKVQRRTVVGVFDDPREAQRAIDALQDAGYTDNQIGFVRRGAETAEGATPIVTDESHEEAAHGAGTGALLGGLIGAAAALLIPGVGPVLAGGVLVHTLGAGVVGGAVVGIVGGAIAGGLVGTLTDMGVSEEDAHYANVHFEAGRTIVTVDDVERYAEAELILREYGAHDIHADRSGSIAAESPRPTTVDSMTSSDTTLTERAVRSQLVEDEVIAERPPLSAGQSMAPRAIQPEWQRVEIKPERERSPTWYDSS